MPQYYQLQIDHEKLAALGMGDCLALLQYIDELQQIHESGREDADWARHKEILGHLETVRQRVELQLVTQKQSVYKIVNLISGEVLHT